MKVVHSPKQEKKSSSRTPREGIQESTYAIITMSIIDITFSSGSSNIIIIIVIYF